MYYSMLKKIPPTELINKTRDFLIKNELTCSISDKNAGITTMKQERYNNEIHNHLLNENIFQPSCETKYQIKMTEWYDKLNYSKIKVKEKPNSFLTIYNHHPASFYILPKVHKDFVNFPPGRPIINTCKTINRNLSSYVDFILKPVTCTIPNIILDTIYFLILLNDCKLDPTKRYALLTYDVESMYTSSKIANCKTFCTNAYHHYIQTQEETYLPRHTLQEMIQLLTLSLVYGFVMCNGEYYLQRPGIQMGNCASVTIANITGHFELLNIFKDKPEIIFNIRFVDDGFLIIDMTHITDIHEWQSVTFKHDYLKFTTTISTSTINYLDVTVSLINNQVYTNIYMKPMSKNLYLSYFSNHASHILKSLPFSQGIRIKRICSSTNDCNNQLKIMLEHFRSRGYPQKLLIDSYGRLEKFSREKLLHSNSKWLNMHLKKFHPHLHMIVKNAKTQIQTGKQQQFYAVIPRGY